MSSGDEPTDADLVERAKLAVRDDFGAFEALVHRYQEKVLGNCRYLTGSRDDAEDLAQEIFVKAFFALERFEGRSSFHTWLWRIKVNHCLNHVRRGRQERTIDVDTPGLDRVPELQVAPVAERSLHTQLDRDLIERSLDAMSETLRIPLLLRDLDGLPYQEIADELNLSLSAVKMRIKRGREDFQRRYAGGLPGREPSVEDAMKAHG